MAPNAFASPDDGLDQERVVSYLEEPHNDPFIVRDLLYGDETSRKVGDVHLDYEDRSFSEIKSQLHDLEDMGVVELENPRSGIGCSYELTDEAHRFFYGKPYTLSWAYKAAQENTEDDIIEEIV